MAGGHIVLAGVESPAENIVHIRHGFGSGFDFLGRVKLDGVRLVQLSLVDRLVERVVNTGLLPTRFRWTFHVNNEGHVDFAAVVHCADRTRIKFETFLRIGRASSS